MHFCILDKTTRLLFSKFPREVDRKRKPVENEQQFQQYIERTNGFDDCFTSTYPNCGQIIDKISTDFDQQQNNQVNINDLTSAFCRFLLSNNIKYIPVITGKKGFHVHVLLKPKCYSNGSGKDSLYAVTLHFIEQTFGKHLANQYIKEDLVDVHLIGNVRSLIRIPNTLRPPDNMTYCTYLPTNFFDYEKEELVAWSKSQHYIDYEIDTTKLPTLEDLIKRFNINIEQYKQQRQLISEELVVSSGTDIRPLLQNVKNMNAFLKMFLRPCVHYNIVKPNPKHDARVVAAIDLISSGFNIKEVIYIFSRLEWVDFDYYETEKQTTFCSRYHRYGCKTLRKLKIPTLCCEF